MILADFPYGYPAHHPSELQEDLFSRRKQRRNRTTFTMQQVRKGRFLTENQDFQKCYSAESQGCLGKKDKHRIYEAMIWRLAVLTMKS